MPSSSIASHAVIPGPAASPVVPPDPAPEAGARGPADRAPAGAPAVGPRQRWRIYLRLPAVTVPGVLPAGAGAWAAILEGCGLPLAGDPGRGRVVPAAQLPLGFAGEREILDMVLGARLPLPDVRDRIRAGLPASIELVELHDVWVGAPSAASAVVAADYRVLIGGVAAPVVRLAAESLLAAATLPRERHREKKTQSFDLRPLILGLSVSAAVPPAGAASDAPAALLRVRLRHRPDAVGRPEDVVSALGEPPAPSLRGEIRVLGIVRERLVLAGDGA